MINFNEMLISYHQQVARAHIFSMQINIVGNEFTIERKTHEKRERFAHTHVNKKKATMRFSDHSELIPFTLNIFTLDHKENTNT